MAIGMQRDDGFTTNNITRPYNGAIYMPDLYDILRRCTRGSKIGQKTRVIAVGGRVVVADLKASRRRWNRQEPARQAVRVKQAVTEQRKYVKSVTAQLASSKSSLKGYEKELRQREKARNKGGRSVLRLDSLRSWVSDHMPSVLEMATDGELARFRFCAAVMRGAGNLAASPNRYVIPAMWVTVSMDTGKVMRVESDGAGAGGALHPHVTEEGNPCIGKAIPEANYDVAQPEDSLKAILTGLETWRLCYGDDRHQPPYEVAQASWLAVTRGKAGLAPIQSTSGRVYEDLNTLLRAEPWDGSKSSKWCTDCDTTYARCECCPTCNNEDGTCGCSTCEFCGQDAECNCCVMCEEGSPAWSYRGSANEHQVCRDCGWCRMCEMPEQTARRAEAIWFLVESDVRRVIELARLQDERDRLMVRPPEYRASCTCDNCVQYTARLRRRSG